MTHHRQNKLHRIAGFTLIELLVVVVIAAIVSSVVLIAITAVGDDRELQREARRLGSLIELASDEAELQGRDYGIEFLQSGYRFVEYDPIFERWSEILGDDILRVRSLPEGFEFELHVEDRRVQLNPEPAATDTDEEETGPLLEKYAPHALVLSSGDRSPFDVDVIRLADDATVRISVALDGSIDVDKDEDAL